LRTGFNAVNDDEVVVAVRVQGLTHVGIFRLLFATDSSIAIMRGAGEGAGDGRTILGKRRGTGGSEHVDRTPAGRAEG